MAEEAWFSFLFYFNKCTSRVMQLNDEIKLPVDFTSGLAAAQCVNEGFSGLGGDNFYGRADHYEEERDHDSESGDWYMLWSSWLCNIFTRIVRIDLRDYVVITI